MASQNSSIEEKIAQNESAVHSTTSASDLVEDWAVYLALLCGGVFALILATLFFTAAGMGSSSDVSFYARFSCCAAGCVVAALVGYWGNDYFATEKGVRFQVALSCICSTLGSALVLVGFWQAEVVLSFGVLTLFLLWGRCVVLVSHRMFVVVMAISMLLMGLAGCFLFAIGDVKTYVIIGWLLSFVSVAFFFLAMKRPCCDMPQLRTREESKANESPLSVSFGPAISGGLMAAVALSLVFVHAENAVYGFLPMGIAFVIGAMLCLLQLVPNFKYEQFLRSHASCFKLIPFFLFPLAVHFDYGIFAAASMLVVACYLPMFLASLTERVRLIDLSSFYVYGRHGIAYFAAALCGFLIVGASEWFFPRGSVFCMVIFCGLAFVVEWVLVSSLNWGTTYDQANSQKDTSKESIRLKRRATWKDKVDSVAGQYGLSARQQEVLVFLAQGRNAQYIAGQLCITVATAKTHIYNIYLKLGIHTQQELLDMIDKAN